jgi:hypothetical protein
MYPSLVSTTPEPSAEPVLIDTTLGSTFAATCARDDRPMTVAGAALPDEAVAEEWSRLLARRPPPTPADSAMATAATAATAIRDGPPRRTGGLPGPCCPVGGHGGAGGGTYGGAGGAAAGGGGVAPAAGGQTGPGGSRRGAS